MDLDTDIEVLPRQEISPTTCQLPIRRPKATATSYSLIGRENASQVRASTKPLVSLRRSQSSERRHSGDLGESNHFVRVGQGNEIRVHDYRNKQHERDKRGTGTPYIVIAGLLPLTSRSKTFPPRRPMSHVSQTPSP